MKDEYCVSSLPYGFTSFGYMAYKKPLILQSISINFHINTSRWLIGSPSATPDHVWPWFSLSLTFVIAKRLSFGKPQHFPNLNPWREIERKTQFRNLFLIFWLFSKVFEGFHSLLKFTLINSQRGQQMGSTMPKPKPHPHGQAHQEWSKQENLKLYRSIYRWSCWTGYWKGPPNIS